jgi:triosephosphate isomerase (TIM)
MVIGTKLVAGNWKMNGLRQEGAMLAHALKERAVATDGRLDCGILVCPPATLLSELGGILAGSAIALGGQDCHPAPKGAYTGDISAEMLADLGCSYVILGHSERRQGHGETDAGIRDKIAAAWRAGLSAILCVGETRRQREAGEAVEIVSSQLANAIPDNARAATLVVAYEPVWAIGTGLTPTTEDIAAMHAEIRSRIPSGTRILYGGSVNPKNASTILHLPEVDGALVGGASLKADDFWTIVQSCPAE